MHQMTCLNMLSLVGDTQRRFRELWTKMTTGTFVLGVDKPMNQGAESPRLA